MLGGHLVHDEVPDLSCWGNFVWIFPLQKADGRTIKVLLERRHGLSLDSCR